MTLRVSLALFVISGCIHAEVGSLACAPCHRTIYDSYRKTAMANSSGSIAQPAHFASQTFSSPGGTVAYSVGSVFSAKVGDVEVTRPLEYFIGSGAVGRSYLTRVGQYLFQAPVSFYAQDSTWRVSPGFERSETLNVSRPVEASCLNCHSSGVRLIAGSVNQYEDTPFREGGIGCERCHGSGERHATLVNPAKLAPAARDSICEQCHLAGEVRVGKASFVWDPPKSRQVNGHVEELSRSRCKLASGDKLWCGSCHDPHSTPLQKAAWYRERCFACHNTASCTAPKPARTAKADDCTACHMPRSEVRDVQHAAYTDHTIPKRPRAAITNTESHLVAFGGVASDRDLAVATALVALRQNDRAMAMQAFEPLKTAWQKDPNDTAVGSQLAQLYDRMGQEPAACEIYGQIAKTPVPPPAAAINWGTCLAKQGRVPESIPFWRSVTVRSPGEESAWTNLAAAYIQTENLDAARAALQAALRFHPVSAKLREMLRSLPAGPSARFSVPRPEHSR